MSAVPERLEAIASETDDEPKQRPFTVQEYVRMAEAGILSPNEKLELLDGTIVKKMSPIGAPHLWCVKRLNQLFVMKLAGKAFVSTQNPLMLDDYNEPEPDLVLLRLEAEKKRPTAQDALLVVEVSDTTVETDRRVKVPLYAAFGVREMWLVDLTAYRLEVYCEPKEGLYRQKQVCDDSQMVSPLRCPSATFSVAEILGTKPLQ